MAGVHGPVYISRRIRPISHCKHIPHNANDCRSPCGCLSALEQGTGSLGARFYPRLPEQTDVRPVALLFA